MTYQENHKTTKKILIIIRTFLLGGGMQRSAGIIGTKLYNRGYDVYYLTFSKVSATIKTKGRNYSQNENYYRLSEAKGLKNFLKNIKNVLKSLIFINPKIIKDFSYKHNVDLIISFGEFNNLPVLLSRVLFNNKCKIIVSIRNNPDISYAKSRSIPSILIYFLLNIITIKLLYKKADMIVPLSKGVGNSLYNYGFSKSSVKPIYNLFDINSCLKLSKEKVPFEYRGVFKNSFVFINIGRLVKQKGQIHLIRSFKKVVAKFDNAKLVILGDGILKKELKQLVLNLNLEKNVFFVGVHSNIFPFLKKSNCFVFTSMWEGFGNVIVEALSVSIPVISVDYKFGGREILCPELDLLERIEYPYHGKYGILTKPFKAIKNFNDLILSDEENVFANVMIKIIEDPDMRNKYSNGLIRAKDFDEKKIIQQWENLINKI